MSAETNAIDAGAPDLAPAVHQRAPARADHAFGYDSASRELIVYGGDDGTVVSTVLHPRYHDDTWVYDLASGDWSVTAAKGPSARGRAAYAMDTKNRRLLVTLGRAYAPGATRFTLPADTWAYDVAAGSWSPLPTTGTPPGRHSVVSQYDAQNDRLVVFGGDTRTPLDLLSQLATDETWQLVGGSAWSRVAPRGGPPPRRYLASSALDTRRNQMIVFGGVDEMGNFYNDVWALDFATDTWTQIMPDTSTVEPSMRIGAAIAYEAASDSLVVFAGHDLSDLGHVNDTFVLNLSGAPAWKSVSAGDQGDMTTLGCGGNQGEQGYHFTAPDEGSPERRERSLFGAAGDRLVLLGGEGDCSQLDDTWHFLGGGWVRAIPATKGESCLRRHDSCPCLCN